ncbi:MAG: heme ABC exporter ATP-binding protein CcmA [Rickettsiaceae bacterium]|nr:heme ABC exporter ATP-binding protein CcmA [Rickettsiaceae bacterium]
MLSLNNITIETWNKKLISDLSFNMAPGSITYVTGPNGSGKTSLLKIIANLKKPASGYVSIYDHKLEELEKPYCLLIGHEFGIDPDMKIRDQIRFWASSYNSEAMIPPAIEYWGIANLLDHDISALSKGMAKKIALSKLTLCHSEIWLLDEAETNLDEQNLRLLHNLIKTKANAGGIIVMTTHLERKIDSSQTLDLKLFTP